MMKLTNRMMTSSLSHSNPVVTLIVSYDRIDKSCDDFTTIS